MNTLNRRDATPISTRLLSLSLAIAILFPSPLFAASVTAEGGISISRSVPTVPAIGVVPLGTVSVPVNALPTVNTALATPELTNVPNAQAVQAAGAAVAAHPVIDIINQMQAKGIAMPASLSSQQDASAWVSAAQVLPEGQAKDNIMSMAAAAAAGPAGKGVGSALDKTYDGTQAAKASEPSAPATFWEKLSQSRWVPSGLRKRLQKTSEAPAKPKALLMPVDQLAVPLDKARYTPDLSELPASTREISVSGNPIVGQDRALKSIRAGLEMTGPSYNLFISGPDGSGRETALKNVLDEVAPKMTTSLDLVAVTNFGNPDQPVLLKLSQGAAPRLAAAVKQFVRTMQAALPQALNSDQAKELKKAVNAELGKAAEERQAKFDAAVAAERVGKFGIRIVPEDAGDGEHYNFGVALTYEDPDTKTMKTVSSEEELQQVVSKGVFTMEEWSAGLKAAKAAAEPYMDEFRGMMAENNAEKQIAYQKMYQQVAAMLVQQLGSKVMSSVMASRHDTPEHKAWSESAQKRMAALQEEISKVNVKGYGILLDENSAATGNIGLSHQVNGEMVPMTPDELAAKQASGEVNEDLLKEIIAAAKPIMQKMAALGKTLDAEHKALHAKDPPPTADEKKALTYVKALLQHAVADFESFLPGGGAGEGAIGRRDPLDHYRVNVLRSNEGVKGAKVVFETKPSLERLLGIVENNTDVNIVNGVALKTKSPGGPTIRSGTLLQADVIIMNAMDLLREPGAWHAVAELIRNGAVEIPEEGMFGMPQMTGKFHVEHRPKIVLIGSPYIKMLLAHYDEDFQRGFNASAEFTSELDINKDSISGYLQFMRKVVIRSAGQVMDFNQSAIGAVLEYASFEAESNEKFSAQFGAIYNLMREATRLAKNAGRKEVTREDVQGALSDRKDGSMAHQKRYMELLENRVFIIDTEGMKKNQANGLVVMGDFGAPARVTFVESMGEGGGIVSNDQAAHWTGHSMDKAFANVQGYYEGTYGKAVSKIIKRYSFEQTYGGLDGDSATGIKTALGELSMAGLALRQDGAMTGSMDQLGNIQAIGGVNHKIEGLFDLLNFRGQLVPKENIRERAFVIVPRSNVSQLTLKPEVIQAIREKRFVIYGVENVRQAEEILSYAPYAEVQRRVREFSKHEALMNAAKAGLVEKYAGKPSKLKAALAELEKSDEAWKAQMEAEAAGYRTAALTPKN